MKFRCLMMTIVLIIISCTSYGEVKLYGSVQAEYTVESLDNGTSEQGIGDSGRQTHIGIKATESLGRDLQAIAVLEFYVDPTDIRGDDSFDGTRRQKFVGLKHKKWGFLGLGTFNSPYKMAGGVNLDPFAWTSLEARGNGGMSWGSNGLLGHANHITDSIYYRSPVWMGFRLDFAAVVDERSDIENALDGECDNVGACVDDDDVNDYSIAINFRIGFLWGFVAHAQNAVNNHADEQATKLGLQINWGGHVFSTQYEWIENAMTLNKDTGANGIQNYSAPDPNNVTDGTDAQLWFIAYQLEQGNNIFVAQIGGMEADDKRGQEADYWAVGVIHRFSRRTRLFAGYSATNTNTSTMASSKLNGGVHSPDRQVFAIGLRKDF